MLEVLFSHHMAQKGCLALCTPLIIDLLVSALSITVSFDFFAVQDFSPETPFQFFL